MGRTLGIATIGLATWVGLRGGLDGLADTLETRAVTQCLKANRPDREFLE